MCGIAGFMAKPSLNDETLRNAARGMGDALTHRGPDGFGEWADASSGVAFAHRRLAIVDLSEGGHQPMASASGRYVITFNGEVYNFLALKKKLSGYPFRGTSDTEVMLAAFETWGLERSLREMDGMFAFALWDRQDRRLHLARDRVGKKPLYYGWCGGVFLFGSELKALRAHPAFSAPIDRNALAAYTRHNYVPAPWSIYQGIYKLPPAHGLSLSGDMQRVDPWRYWDFKAIAEEGSRAPLDLSLDEAADGLEQVLGQAVRDRMIADVPLGAFLSGGIDSSLIVALMQKNSAAKVKTYSIGFAEAKYNEANDARAVARHLGTDHTEFTVTSDEARAVIPSLPAMFDEPFADSSQIPTWHVARLARQQVTVALSGDGGDESFGGYERYAVTQRVAQGLFLIPRSMRVAAARILQHTPVSGRTRKLVELMDARDSDEFYRRVVSYWNGEDRLVIDGTAPLYPLSNPADVPAIQNYVGRMMARDTMSYLPDDILVKVDRASMVVALEARAPLLDHKVIEYAWRLPMAMKMQHGRGKIVLRHLLARYVPETLFDRPKQGFGIPLAEWLRGPLRGWAEDLLSEGRLRQEGFFAPGPIRRRWDAHRAGRDDWSYPLWGILMFQAWLAAQQNKT